MVLSLPGDRRHPGRRLPEQNPRYRQGVPPLRQICHPGRARAGHHHTSYPNAEELGADVRTSQYKNNVMEQDHRGIKGRYRSMRGFKAFRSADRFCRAFDELPAPDPLHQPERFARPSAGHPRPACRCAAGPDFRRLIQLLVSISLALSLLASKADRTARPLHGLASPLLQGRPRASASPWELRWRPGYPAAYDA
jgi:DDE domain